MEGRMSAAEARIEGNAEQIKGAYKRIEKIEDKIDRLSSNVAAFGALFLILIPVATTVLSNYVGGK
jgi:preprotein translocase subunit SecY